MFSFEGVELEFTKEALQAVAAQAIKRKTGARGLRGVLEEAMLDIMYDVPGNTKIKKIVINENVTDEEIKSEEQERKKKESA